MPGRADLSKPFKCPKCPKKFTKRYIRDTHVIEKHENAGRFKCDGCDRSFQSEYQFEVHKKTHTGEKPFVCTVCQKSFARDETRRNHVLTMHENAGRFRCSYADCPKTFQIKHVLELHERTHMEEKELFECPVCQKGFTREDIRDNHVIVVHENAGRFKCSVCPRSFQVKGQWEKHERSHMDEKPFRCELCQMSFKSEDSVRLHHRNKHGEKKFACEQCGKRFGTKSGLNEHLLTHEEKTFQCELCPKVFNNERLLASHHRFYHEKAFGCEYCGKRFGANHALKLHLAIHSGETPFQCELCPDKKFTRKDYLRDHNRACHAKAWKCKICGKGFGKKWALENHQSVHSDEKPFQCPECPKSFAGKWSLYQHTQDWHSEKKFTCEHCGKGFRRPRPYKEHLLSHSDERVSCELCGKSLRPLSLRFHMKAVHSVKAPPRLVLGENQKENPKDQDENSNENQKEDQNEKPKEQLKEHQKEQPKKQPKEQPKKQPKKPRVKVEQPEGNDSGSATYSLRVRRNAPNYRAGQDDDESEQSEATEQSEESGSEFQESDDDETEVDEESGGEDELSEIDVENGGEDEPSEIDVENVEEDEVVGSDGMPSEEQDYDNVDEMPAKRMKTEHWVDDGDVQAFDDPTSGSQQTTTDQTIKREPGSDDGQTENNQGVNNQADLSEEPKDSKFVPIQSEATAFDCYDFNDLIKNNHSRMKAESDSQSPMVVQADHDVELPQESNADSSANLKVIYDVEYQAPQ